jgi:uncharacterized membrane protein YeaQ/YmgE (transglycosylase-associated protein family)
MVQPMSGPGLFVVVVIGLLAGVLARRLVAGRRSLSASLGLGLAGAVLGAVAAGVLGLDIESPTAFALAALTGAVTLLALLGLIPKR